MRVAVVILNYNGRHYLEKFLPGVVANSKGHRVIVADNCSTDDSVDFLKSNFPEAELILNTTNKGYSYGYNEALGKLKQEKIDYYVLLNSDVEVTPNWIEPVVKMMDEDSSIAAAQPKILDQKRKTHFEYAGAAGGHIDTLGYPFCRGRLFLNLEQDQGQYNDPQQIFWATGACLFIRSSVFHQLDGFDPDFFAHMEEIDLCWRINNAGLKVYYNGESKVYHVGGGTLDKSNPRKTYLNFRNGLSLLYKNYTTSELWLKLPIRILLDIVASIKFMVFDSFKDGLAVIRAHVDFVTELRSNFKKRQATKRQKKMSKLPIIYSGSIVFEHFVKGKQKYSQLKSD
ncbi:glycosyltransferase family 2 protein [Fulvivirga sp. RKSG066]|uniref:glycosyltransferase family 2 protein n=1 Tax=Fulvivirga aurantia TaxID=2529383 RepID=UPI0012BCF575|nr:glycosyltransferase family 2 protein [Fulvivirga aurantia]MTI20667.1 glycosyltransferase family 2 protein [Fulvivirga aurantia]